MSEFREELAVFKERFILLRRSTGLKQDEFASTIGVAHPTEKSYEAGHTAPSVKALINMSNEYGISIDWLLGTSDETPDIILGMNDVQKTKKSEKSIFTSDLKIEWDKVTGQFRKYYARKARK